jgi:predicted lipoprotein with Yx(FWY)xxD motif
MCECTLRAGLNGLTRVTCNYIILVGLEITMRNRWWATGALAAATLTAAAACGSSGSSSPGSSGSSASSPASAASTSHGVKTAKIGGATVLTNTKGFTLYTFVPDTSTASKCYGTCAQYWPPLKGPVSDHSVTGTFGTIKRTNGTLQATYNGHPLYTYVSDTAPGQAKGNGVNLSGGIWHEATVTGSAPAAPASSSSSGGSGGGY